MKQEKKLEYSQKNNRKSKNFRNFVISFAAFVIVLGAISLLMFMKSLNFDLKNLVSSSDELTTEPQTQESTAPVAVTGGLNVVTLCSNSDSELSFAFLIKCDYETMKSEVSYIPITLTASYNGITSTLNSHFTSGGAEVYTRAFEAYSGIRIDKYILVNESQFKSFMAKFKDVTVNVPQAIKGDNAEGLTLNMGSQSLTSDLLLKYIKYIDNAEKSKAFCNMLSVVFDAENAANIEKLFNYLINNSQSDISIVDFTGEKEKILAFVEQKGEFIPVETLSEMIGEVTE